MGEALVLDPLTESSANAPLWLQAPSYAALGVRLAEQDYPQAEDDSMWASSPETEGEIRASTRPQRTVIPVTLQVVEPTDATATNKATNPVAAVGTTGITNTSLTTFARVAALPARLDGFDTAIHGIGNADDDNASWSAAVTNGVAETFGMWVYVVSGVVRLEVWTNGPALLVAGSDIAVGAWRRVVLPYTPSSTNTYTFRVAQNGAGACEFYATGALIGPADPYFDGDSPGCFWTGARHASTSTRRAPGGARYLGILADIEAKVAKLNRSGGTYRRTLPSGDTITYDVQAARVTSETHDLIAEARRAIKVGLEFTRTPYGRGAEVTV